MSLDPLLSPLVHLPHLIAVHKVAHRLDVKPQTVRRLIRHKKLPAYRVGARLRVDPRDVDAYLLAHRVNGSNGSSGHGNGGGA
ncbi:MAG: helix-turn-helix domain-containing protein [Acidobacteriota bacterium]